MKFSIFKFILISFLTGFLAACDNSSDSNDIVDYQVTSNVTEAPVGINVQVYAYSYFEDGSIGGGVTGSVWSVDDESIATVAEDGVLTGKAVGDVVVTASDGKFTDSTTITINAAAITAIQVTPGSVTLTENFTLQYEAKGDFTDNSTHDVTNNVIWESTTPSVADFDPASPAGLVTAFIPGGTNVLATLQNVISPGAAITVTDARITEILITPPAVAIPFGLQQQYKAIATYEDNSTSDVSNQVTWHSSDRSIADFDSSGLLSTDIDSFNETGLVVVTASVSSAVTSNSAYALVTTARITEIAVTPDSAQIAKNTAQQYHAEGLFSDGSKHDLANHPLLGWHSSNTNIAIIDPEGVVRAVFDGPSDIKATVRDISATTSLTVSSAVVTSLDIKPSVNDMLISKGGTVALIADATFDDLTSQDVSGLSQANWVSDDLTVATVSFSGVATGIGANSVTESIGGPAAVTPATIRASFQGQTDTTVLVGTACPALTVDKQTGNDLEFTCALEDNAADQIGNLNTLLTAVEGGTTGPFSTSFIIMDQATANTYCNDLNYNGFSDWRLPSSSELGSLFLAYDDFGNEISILSASYYWPVSQLYWTSNNTGAGTYTAFDLGTAPTGGASTSKDETDELFAGCVREKI